MPTDTVPLIDNLQAPDVFIDDVVAIVDADGVVRLSLAVGKWDAETRSPHRLIVGRVCLPIAGAQRLSVNLHDYLVKIGADPSKAATGDMARN